MILEGIVTTISDDGGINISPMGPDVQDVNVGFRLKPFQTSKTYHNLKRAGQGVFHLVDDAELLARAAIGQLPRRLRLVPATCVEGRILADACSWHAFRVDGIEDQQARATIHCRVVGHGPLRPFAGWNRARHAVLEAAILATRLHLIPVDQIRQEYARLQVIVDKTAGAREQRAFQLLQAFVNRPC